MMNLLPKLCPNLRKPLEIIEIHMGKAGKQPMSGQGHNRNRTSARLLIYILQSLFVWFLVLSGLSLSAQPSQEKTELKRILFVFDASQSMWGKWEGKSKMELAKALLIRVVDSLQQVPDTELALRLYGHQFPYPPGKCTDSKLEVAFAKNNHFRIKAVLRNLVPKGTTPIAYAIGEAAKDFEGMTDSRNMIILITDGLEECGGDPCAVSRELQSKGIIMKPFVIGLGTGMSGELDCIGTYFDADDADNFAKALNLALKQVSKDLTTVTVELADGNDVSRVTDIVMTFYEQPGNTPASSFVHTLTSSGIADTLYLDHHPQYRLELHTRPSLNLNQINLLEKQHNTIRIPVLQGKIQLSASGSMPFGKELYGLVKRCGKDEIIHVIHAGQAEDFLAGCYDVEVLSLPRLIFEGIVLEEKQTRHITVPQPGVLVLQRRHPVIGDLFVEHDGKLVWIYSLDSESVTTESLVLLPGNYRVIYRASRARKAAYTRELNITITPGKSLKVKL